MYRNFSKIISRPLTEHDRTVVISAFYRCDLGHKGYLDKEDLKVATVALFGYKPSRTEVRQLLENQRVRNKDEEIVEGISLEAFTNVMLKKMSTTDEDEEIRQIFLAFDSQCRGFLTLSDLEKAVASSAPHLRHHAIETAFREIDRDGDGRVSYRDFEYMMKYNTDVHI